MTATAYLIALVMPTKLWEYCLAAFLIILAPGPSVLFTIARAIAWGRKTAVATVAGNVLGAFSLSCVVAIGLGPLISHSTLVYVTIQISGGIYLCFLGFDAIKHSQLKAQDIASEKNNQSMSAPSLRKSIRDGYWVGALNPKGAVFFASIVPSFVDRSKGHVTSQLLSMGAIFSVMAFFSDGAWGVLAGTLRNWLSHEIKRLQRLRVAGGCVMFCLGLFTIISGIGHIK
jgi:threonine/homoserine/homoserine lactone efflux protein